jgi:hypothetical protein
MDHIIEQWNNGTSSSDIYHLILQLLQSCRSLQYMIEMQHIFDRMTKNDSTTDIVSDFIYSDFYKPLRDNLPKIHTLPHQHTALPHT